ncbi:MAG TPA: hypothetical protein VJL28_03220 [Gemmatimonadaceae bacterium]|nr:hypothetical protein [Gemmatimonadaceae bacterium]
MALACTLVLAYLAVRRQLYVSWTPSDDGVLAQGAERVMRGELPHKDFVALWSGGLDYLNAAAFRLLGPSLATLRTVVAAAWLVALAALFVAARHLVSAWAAAALTLCAALWTLPLSPHPLPSWYNLAFALLGVAAVLQFLRARSRAWLAAAGLAAGASCAVKIVGLYFVAAVLLFLVFQVQEDVPGSRDGRPSVRRAYAWLVSAGLLAFLVFVVQLVRSAPSLNAVGHFVAPSVLLVGVLLWREWRLPAHAERERFGALWSLAWPFVLGFSLAVTLWVAPYVARGALADLWRGVFVTPRLRFLVASYPLPGLRSAGLAVLPFALLLAGAPFVRRPLKRRETGALAALVMALIVLAYDGSPLVNLTWYGLRLLTPVAVGLAAWWLVAPPRGMEIPAERRGPVFFLVAAAVTGSLVQVPFALYTYFLYFLPLLALALTALATAQPAMPRAVPAALLAYVLLFGARGPDSLPPRTYTRPEDALAPLALERGGIVVSREDSAAYARLIASIRRHAAGEWIYVWHDAPQLYFLSGMRNPTGTMYETFDDSVARSTAHLTRALETHDVRLVVLTDPRGAARPLDPAFRAWLNAAFPESERVDLTEVRWRRGPLPRR